MDPSCTLAFYCHTQEDFLAFVKEAEKVSPTRSLLAAGGILYYNNLQVISPPMQKGQYPFFSFCEKRYEEMIRPEVTSTEEPMQDAADDSDGFIVLDCTQQPP